MRSYLEMPVFIGLAAALHVGFVLPGGQGSASSMGAGGDSALTLQASAASVAQMVADWEQPPEVDQAVLELDTPDIAPPEVETPEVPQFEPVQAMSVEAYRADAPPLPILRRPENAEPADAPPPASRPLAVDTSPIPQPRPELDTPPPAPTQVAPPQAQPPKPQPPKPQPPKPQPPRAAPPKPVPPAPQPPRAAPRERPKPSATGRSATSSVASRGSAATRAAGQGGGVAAGRGGSAEAGTLSQSRRQSLMARWGAQVRARIARRAPRGVGRGTVRVRVVLSGSGQVLGVSVVKSSGNSALDSQAVRAVRRIGRFPKAPAGLQISKHGFIVPITSRR